MVKAVRKILWTLCVLMLSGEVFSSRAQDLSFLWDLDFEFVFNNHEYAASEDAFAPSHTLAGARLTPSAGLGISSEDGSSHRIMAGLDLTRRFGSPFSISSLISEATLFYEYRKPFSFGSLFSMTAGIFPRSALQGEYTEVIVSDDIRFIDNNIDGLLLQMKTGRGSYEVCLDWNGMKSPTRRERFNVLTAGNVRITPLLSAGWQGMFQHYAGMVGVTGIVVDEDLLNPYLRLSFAEKAGIRCLDFTVGPMLAYQRDRRAKDRRFPLGADLIAAIGHWSLTLSNELYWGDSLAPFWVGSDVTGTPYADNLYFRSPFYQVSIDGKRGFYDKIEFNWTPRIADWVFLRLGAAAHFNGGFSGWQQKASIIFDLNPRKQIWKRKQ